MQQNATMVSNTYLMENLQGLKRACLFALVLCALLSATPVVTFAQGSCPLCLNDYFAQWTTNSTFLNNLAYYTSSPNGTFVPPALGFGQSGLQMSGLSADYTLTGVQSLVPFSAPFTFSTTAMASQGTANPIAIYLASNDLSQYVSVQVNFSSEYDGIWANAESVAPLWQLGEQFSPSITPSLDTLYQLIVAVDSSGNATVTVKNAQGSVLGTLTGLQCGGAGPFYVVLGQRVGNSPGSQAASYKSVSLNPSH